MSNKNADEGKRRTFAQSYFMETPTTKICNGKCNPPCDECKELLHPDEATGGKYLPDSNGLAIISWVNQNCRFAQIKGKFTK